MNSFLQKTAGVLWRLLPDELKSEPVKHSALGGVEGQDIQKLIAEFELAAGDGLSQNLRKIKT